MIREAEAGEGSMESESETALQSCALRPPRARLRRGQRLAPGPLRPSRRRDRGVAAGALVGALAGLAVLAALGLPLLLAIVSEGARRPEAAPARAADRAALAQDKAR
ncbi:hypothetical protein AwMethylo_04940 [Methylobacterium sp.]|nr:hypothetical protein AwMethylo_04940 [Methylobacterium sp.]